METPSQENILNIFSDAVKSEEVLRWIAYADRLLKFRNNHKERSMTGADVVYEVLDRVLSDARTFNEKISIEQYVKMTIKSIIDGEYKKTSRLVYEGDSVNSMDEESEVNSIFDKSDKTADMDVNKSMEDREALDKWLGACKDDEDAQIVIMEIFDGRTKNQDIADSLGIKTSDVINIKKRIKRRMDRKLLNF